MPPDNRNKTIYDKGPADILYYGGHGHIPNKMKFDYKKGQQALQAKDHTGYYTYRAGAEWPEFDFKSGFDHLVNIGLRLGLGDWLYKAGLYWKKFNYQKAFDALKQISPKFSEWAHEHWPKGALETIEISKDMKASSTKMEKKPFGLKEDTNPYMFMTPYKIFKAGLYANFDSNLGLSALIKKRSAKQIYGAGTFWKDFDYKKGLDALIKYDKRGEWIFLA
jgi:hypothetical protein